MSNEAHDANEEKIEALNIQVLGVVQGVGFRPFVYKCAHELGIAGWVLNAVDGVTIHAEGPERALDKFVMRLVEDAPDAAQVTEINLAEVPVEGFESFEIRFSDDAEAAQTTLVSPDLATCDACTKELFDPENRRYHYPFINCTNCGPRFTIIDSLPYDRARTSMRDFTMDEPCQAEYDDPLNRRFHAQPNACFNCGPRLGWIDAVGMPAEEVRTLTMDSAEWAFTVQESDGFIEECASLLRAGKIVAVKGLGGFHLVCDAKNPEALATLRERKKRPSKPFAVMAGSVKQAREYAEVSEAERRQLEHPARPIVLLRKLSGLRLAAGLADSLPELGVMLPATPVQHLLAAAFGGLLVMTSGNLHDDPIVIEEHEAFEQLAGIADAFLINNRAIVERFDDSVVRVLEPAGVESLVQVIRRARGLAPSPVKLPDAVAGGAKEAEANAENAEAEGAEANAENAAAESKGAKPEPSAPASSQILAVGPELKNTFTITRGAEAFVSQHLGDMEHAANFDNWLVTKNLYEQLFHLEPTALACDLHPEYLLSKWARTQAQSQNMPLAEVQHHHAHVVSAMAENNLPAPVCGIAFDGTGYGVDGAIWGGEVLLSNLQTYERFANVAYFPLPGGAQAIAHTNRCAFGVLWASDLLEHPFAQQFFANKTEEVAMLTKMVEGGINTPFTSSMGRLFDAASALMGICEEPYYEGEAAILLEAEIYKGLGPAVAHTFNRHSQAEQLERYQFSLLKNTASEASTAQDTSVLLLDPAPVFEALLDDLQVGVEKPLVALRFHEAVVSAIQTMAEAVRQLYEINTVVLSGGVFMNRYLMERVLCELQAAGFTIALNRELPPNDACISYGQAVIGLQQI